MTDLDKHLLGLVIRSPRAALSAAVSLGITVGLELAIRKRVDVMHRIDKDKAVRDSVLQAILTQWVESSKARDMTEKQFTALCDRIVSIASAS